MDPVRKRATYDDLLALPDDVRAEIIDGEVRVLPASLPRLSFIQNAVGSSVGVPFQHADGRGGPGGWWILPKVDVRFERSETVRPDLTGWRRDRLPDPWDIHPIDIVPDWICEILSPSNARHDQVTKRALYAKHGVPFYWIVDPETRTLTDLQRQGTHWFELGVWDDTATVRIPPFDVIELEIGALLPPLPSPVTAADQG